MKFIQQTVEIFSLFILEKSSSVGVTMAAGKRTRVQFLTATTVFILTTTYRSDMGPIKPHMYQVLGMKWPVFYLIPK